MEEELEVEMKVIVVGNGGVGKSTLLRRFSDGVFQNEYKKTIGADFLEKQMYVDKIDKTVKFMLWDTAGQEEFDSICQTYYRGAAACVVAFSTIDRESFEAVESWIEKVNQHAESSEISFIIVQNKIDLAQNAVVSEDETKALGQKTGFKFLQVSSKENVNVETVFTYLADQYFNKEGNESKNAEPQPKKETIKIGSSQAAPKKEKKKGFCNVL